MMDAWMREPNQETMKRMLLMVCQTESLFCPYFLRENMNTAVTSVHTATEHQTLVDLAFAPAHSQPRMEKTPKPIPTTKIHREFQNFHSADFWETRASILSSGKGRAFLGRGLSGEVLVRERAADGGRLKKVL